MKEGELKPVVILICCEGSTTEPAYFKAVMDKRRINSSMAIVEVVGGKGQHQTLIDQSLVECNKLAKKLDLPIEDIEIWAVCDKDQMKGSLLDLETYAAKNGVRLAFSDPRFEVYLLQHFRFSATNETGKKLEALVTKEMGKLGIKRAYDKADLRWLHKALDDDPALVDVAIKNGAKICNKDNTPYTTMHLLMARILEFEVGS